MQLLCVSCRTPGCELPSARIRLFLSSCSLFPTCCFSCLFLQERVFFFFIFGFVWCQIVSLMYSEFSNVYCGAVFSVVDVCISFRMLHVACPLYAFQHALEFMHHSSKIWCIPRVSINVLALLSGGGIRLASCLMLSTVEPIRGWFSSLVSNISIWSCSHSYIRFRFARLSADIQLRLFGHCCISSVLSWLFFRGKMHKSNFHYDMSL